jgi:hypothetical protein
MTRYVCAFPGCDRSTATTAGTDHLELVSRTTKELHPSEVEQRSPPPARKDVIKTGVNFSVLQQAKE